MNDELMDGADPLPRHVGLVVMGHLDSGKSTLCGRLLLEFGRISDRELGILKRESVALGKESFLYAFCMDRMRHERQRGLSMDWRARDFCTDSYHYTIFDAPGHRYDGTLSFCFQPFNASLFGTANITKT